MIFNIQRYSTHDGPGIRTVVSSKVARWAAAGVKTRKSRSRTADLLYDPRLCLAGCNLCQQAAPDAITRSLDGLIIHRQKLTAEGYESLRDCCPTTALSVCGEEKEVAQIMATVLRDKPFTIAAAAGSLFPAASRL
ncbi:Pyruvate formate-lyase activating enzyme [Raoultella terrigena]|uniref:Pyruvate formate-lyase activating enzyme n=1 Tax=Raoultella terrigena TaxID=577 RepID=A0A7Z8ZDW3_RAOTE|nr:Pyruvate formate-lyase activating enzyme [Raoultella terrigena]